MMMFMLAAHAADPVALAPFRIGASERGNLDITQEDWSAELTAALAEAGSPVEPGAKAHLTGVVRTAACLRATKARNCEVAIAWELRPAADAPVMYRVVTRGIGGDRGRGDEATREAIKDAAARLVARPRFAERELVAPVAPPPSWTGALTVKQCDRKALKLPTDMDQALHATVVISSGNSMGSGVLVSPDGWVLTAAHVIGATGTPTVRTRGGTSAPATVVRIDRGHDLALLRTTVGDGACLAPQLSVAPPGTEVFAVGSPLGQGLEFSVSKGVISGVREVEGRRFLQTDASVNAGNSGGPLLDETGKIVGIVSWKVAGRGLEGIAFGVPTDSALKRLDFVFGDTSTEGASEGAREAVALVEVDDKPDGSRLQRPKSNVAPGPLIAGLLTSVVGAGCVAGTGIWYIEGVDADDTTVTGWRAAQVINTVGWGLGAGGLGLMIVPMVVSDSSGAAVTVRF